ncbi:PhoU domain-containing protein [Paraburkholderia mimosarum]
MRFIEAIKGVRKIREIEVLFIAKAIERIGDHATNLGIHHLIR